MGRKKVIIMGAAGRDFHNFNVFFRDNREFEVAAFTATQIPDIEGRVYPKELAGKLYPKGIPIESEEKLVPLILKTKAEIVVFAYSDTKYEVLMQKSAAVNAAGADFWLMGAETTMLKSKKPLIAVCAVRTGCGKSQTTRRVCEILKGMGKKVAVIRHPMPYGNLVEQTVQKFEKIEDLEKHKCTIEEMEEYEPHIARGNLLFAGVDYGKILKEAEKHADVIVWDGGNNDYSFYKADLYITVVDPHRAGHEKLYYPSGINVMLADAFVINKEDSAEMEKIEEVQKNISEANPKAAIIHANSPISVSNPGLITGKRVLVIEDGPTLTHGEMKYGAGIVAARKFGAKEIIDPRPFLVGKLKETFEHYPNIGTLLPAMGYGEQQVRDLEATINACDCDSVIVATPIDLSRIVKIKKPFTRVTYDLEEKTKPGLEELIAKTLKNRK
ncbi:MAG: cyclic 2,3-diphosphoglycerate synthase [Candidatus Diapherotrites archaeon]|nr:cyclic 2,3-diphosphoglycerate synthase [Candidatus Diapherotrites archaeon]